MRSNLSRRFAIRRPHLFKHRFAAGAIAVAILLCAGKHSAKAQQGPFALEMPEGARVSFTTEGAGKWRIDLASASGQHFTQDRPARFQFFQTEKDITNVAVPYLRVEQSGPDIVATAQVKHQGAVLDLTDTWSIAGGSLLIRRFVQVHGNSPGGFSSALLLDTPQSAGWDQQQFLLPGALYDRPGSSHRAGPAGADSFSRRTFAVREDQLSAPLLAIRFPGGDALAMLDASPDGSTTEEDTRATLATVLIDERFGFGSFGAAALPDGGVGFGFWFPGSLPFQADGTSSPSSAGADSAVRRYHPLRDGTAQHFTICFRSSRQNSFAALTRDSWRWAWQTLHPAVAPLDVAAMKRAVVDQVASRIETVDGRVGIPWIAQATTGEVWHRPDDRRAALGFCGQNLQLANELLMEADEDSSNRGATMRSQAFAIIASFIRLVQWNPPTGEGFDLQSGLASVNLPASSWRGNLELGDRVYLRPPAEDLRRLLDAFLREKQYGRDHPEWLRWIKSYADWLLPQQHPDGSFPRAWRAGTGEVLDASGSGSYNPIPLFLMLADIDPTSGAVYRKAAIRAGEYVWKTQGVRGVFVGGTIDNPDVVDKEAGGLALDAFLALNQSTHDPVWIERASVAADFAESWIWLWNVPMPEDAAKTSLHWKSGVSTIGLQGITELSAGGVDEWLEVAAPDFAALYAATHDPHYLSTARVLLFDTKGMLALPGRTYDLAGPGWQQEHFNLSLRRGYGGHRGWLPWVSAAHLWSVDGLAQLPPDIRNAVLRVSPER